MKKQTDITKDQYKLFKDQINVSNSNRADESVDDKSDKSRIAKKFDAILKDTENNAKTTKLMVVLKIMVVILIYIHS